MRILLVFITCLLSLGSFNAFAGGFDPSTLPASKRVTDGKYLSPQQAYEMKMKGGAKVLFIDVRTPAETEYVGIATNVDLNIPYMVNDYSSWDSKNHRFKMVHNSAFTMLVAQALKARGLNKSSPIILMCRSGDRSAAADNLLTEDGYTNVYTQYQGFEGNVAKSGPKKGERVVDGWKNAGLPWSYHLMRNQAYLSQF